MSELNRKDSANSSDYSFDTKQEFMAMYNNATSMRSSNNLNWPDDPEDSKRETSQSNNERGRLSAFPSSFNNLSSSNFYYRDPITPIRSTFQPGPLNLPSPGLSPVVSAKVRPTTNETKLTRSSAVELNAQPSFKKERSIEELYSSPFVSDEEDELMTSMENMSLVRIAVGPSAVSESKTDEIASNIAAKTGSKQNSVNPSPITIDGPKGRLFPDDDKSINQEKLFPVTPVRGVSSNIGVAEAGNETPTLSHKNSNNTNNNISDVSIASMLFSDIKSPRTPRADDADVIRTPSNTSIKSLHAVSYLPDTPDASISHLNSKSSNKEFPPFSVTTPNRDRVLQRANTTGNMKKIQESPSPQIPITPLRGIMKQSSVATMSTVSSTQSHLQQPQQTTIEVKSVTSSATTVDMNDPRERNRQLVEKGRQKYGASVEDSLTWSSPSVSPSKHHNSYHLSQSDDSELRRAVISNTALNSTPAKVLDGGDMYAHLSYHRYHQYLEANGTSSKNNYNTNEQFDTYNSITEVSHIDLVTPVKQPRLTPLKKTAAGSSITYFKAKMDKSLNEISLIDETVDSARHSNSNDKPIGLKIGGTYTLILAADGSPVFVPVSVNSPNSRASESVNVSFGDNVKFNKRYSQNEELDDNEQQQSYQQQYPQSKRISAPRHYFDDSMVSYGGKSSTQNPTMMSYLPETPKSTGKLPNRQSTSFNQQVNWRHSVPTTSYGSTPYFHSSAQMLHPATQSDFNDAMAFAAWKATVKATSDEYNYTAQRLESQLSIPLLHYQFPNESFLRNTFPMPSYTPSSLLRENNPDAPRANVYSKNITASLLTPKRFKTSTAPTTPNEPVYDSNAAYHSDPEKQRLSHKINKNEEVLGNSEYFKERLIQRDLTTVLKSPFMSRY